MELELPPQFINNNYGRGRGLGMFLEGVRAASSFLSLQNEEPDTHFDTQANGLTRCSMIDSDGNRLVADVVRCCKSVSLRP